MLDDNQRTCSRNGTTGQTEGESKCSTDSHYTRTLSSPRKTCLQDHRAISNVHTLTLFSLSPPASNLPVIVGASIGGVVLVLIVVVVIIVIVAVAMKRSKDKVEPRSYGASVSGTQLYSNSSSPDPGHSSARTRATSSQENLLGLFDSSNASVHVNKPTVFGSPIAAPPSYIAPTYTPPPSNQYTAPPAAAVSQPRRPPPQLPPAAAASKPAPLKPVKPAVQQKPYQSYQAPPLEKLAPLKPVKPVQQAPPPKPITPVQKAPLKPVKPVQQAPPPKPIIPAPARSAPSAPPPKPVLPKAEPEKPLTKPKPQPKPAPRPDPSSRPPPTGTYIHVYIYMGHTK